MERHSHARCAGHLLLECLIALSVFSIAVLGLAMLQMRSMSLAHGAHLHSLASLRLQDFAERIRMNRDAPAAAYTFGGCPDGPSPTGCSAACPPGVLAARDIAQWCESSRSLLGAGFVDAAAVNVGDRYRISMQLSMRAPGQDGRQTVETVNVVLEAGS